MNSGNFLWVILLLITTNLYAQEVNDSSFDSSCECIGKIDLGQNRQEQFEQVKECIESSIMSNQLISKLQAVLEQSKKDSIAAIGKDEEPREYNVNIDDREGYEDLEEKLLRNCAAMKRVMTTSNVASEVSISDKKSAKKAYDKGMDLYRAKNYVSAIKQFEKATKKDPSFAWAWDMLGISLRNMKRYDEAVLAYDKSINLDPLGRMPLMNKPIAYSLNGKNEKAIEAYKHFINTFPDDPEGYYGIGRIYHIIENYDEALDNIMKAYWMYKEIKSPYVQDAERNLAIIYNDLKDKDKLDIWKIYAEKHKIRIAE